MLFKFDGYAGGVAHPTAVESLAMGDSKALEDGIRTTAGRYHHRTGSTAVYCCVRRASADNDNTAFQHNVLGVRPCRHLYGIDKDSGQ
ncbi:MAG: hypothetical protein JSV82_05920 [Planctomycetota bacterium]|nr:MAG: hypothetical protein JSV82_05920 [Planctomycetota bacterium]